MVASKEDLIATFLAIRDIPYSTNAGYNVASMRRFKRGNCVAKAEAMAESLRRFGMPVQLVRWEYRIPDIVDDAATRGFGRDIHTACRVRIAHRWRLVDATHDAGLASLGLPVASWDGDKSTVPAYEPCGPVLTVGDRDDDDAWTVLVAEIEEEVAHAGPARAAAHRARLNAAFDQARRR